MIRLVVSDVDGTLVKDGTCDINPEYYDVIRALKKLGIRIAIASGRQEDSIRKVFLPVEDELIFISNDGACVSEGPEQVFSAPMPAEILPELVEDIQKLPDCDLALSSRDRLVYFDSASDHFVAYMDSYRFNRQLFEGYDRLPPVYHIGVYHDPRSAHPALGMVEKYKGRADAFVSGHEWVDFTAPGISKGAALRTIQERYGITAEETAVFGDQENDASMLREAEYSFAVAGSVAAEKKLARFIAPPMSEDGVLTVMKQILACKGAFAWKEEV